MNPQDTIAWWGYTLSDHNAMVDQYAAQGFRTLSLKIFGDPQDPRYAAVMTLRSAVFAEQQYAFLNQSDMQQTFDTMAAQGWGPFIISATGPRDSATFAASFTPMESIPLTRLNLSADEFNSVTGDAHAGNLTVISIDGFGDPSDTGYSAVFGPPGLVPWSPDPGPLAQPPHPYSFAWSCDGINDDGPTSQQRFDAQWSAGARPREVVMLAPGQSMVVYTDASVGPVSVYVNMSEDELQSRTDEAIGQDLMPVRISAAGTGGDARYAAIFASREETDQIVARSQGPVSDPNIDQAMFDFMSASNLKGAALAICNGTNLVYAKGYTNAETWYPDIAPTTPFRQASLSKFFTAAAWWQLFQSYPDEVSLQTPVQDILQLSPPPNLSFDPSFGLITLQNLLESRSGLDQGMLWNGPTAAAAYGAPLPYTPTQLASWGACQPSTGPRDNTNVVYGNFDYFLLGLALTTYAQAKYSNINIDTFEDAIRTVLLDPLGIGPTTRGARSLVSSQLPDEAVYHMRVYNNDPNVQLYPLQLQPSIMTPDQPLVPDQYGSGCYEAYLGAGGLSASVVDVARLAACLSSRTSNPAFTADTITNWMTAAANAAQNVSGPDPNEIHGYHGFDNPSIVDAVNMIYSADKGGWDPSHQSYVTFTTGSWTIVSAINGNTPPDPAIDWISPIQQILQQPTVNLSANDLFQSAFGMTSFQ